MYCISTIHVHGSNKTLYFCSYSALPPQGQLGNVLGVTLVLLAGVVMFVVTNAAFRRINTEEEHVSLINEKD